MALSLKELKKQSEDSLELYRKKSEETNQKTTVKDERWWTPTVDKAGNGSAVIRFLPAPMGEDLAWAKYWDYSFDGPTGKKYWEKSLTTLGQKDPVGEYNSQIWNTGDPELQTQARKQKRRENYVSNILVVNDPANPANNGKVFLYRYGKKLFEQKIKAIMHPDADLGEKPSNPFDFWTGRNFKLVVKNVADFRNYDSSVFAKPTQIAETDEEIEDIWKRQYPLKEFTDPANYKSYDDLKARLNEVLGIGTTNSAKTVKQWKAETDTQELETVQTKSKTSKVDVSDDVDDDLDIDSLLSDIDLED